MNSHWIAALVGVLAAQLPELRVLDDVAKLQGTWTYATLELDGKSLPAELFARSRLEVSGVQFMQTDGKTVHRGTFKLDGTRNPKTIDLTFTDGPEKGNTTLGIYEINGDEWKLCLPLGTQPRPTAFATKAGSGYALQTLKRKPPPSPAEIARAELARFEGEWIITSGQNDGKPIPDSELNRFRRIVKADQTTVMNGQHVFMRAKFSLDPHRKPKAIDYTLLQGENKGVKQLGIYEWVEDSVRICFAAPGKDRPTDFRALAGSGHTVGVWKRDR
jgi:uncharacterized protein (TIGR03067 family)